MERIEHALLLLFLALSLLTASLPAQTNDQLRSTAESALQRMTPEEIDRKLKEMGITRDEAIRRASELNISLEDYLSSGTQNPAGATSAPEVQPPQERRQVLPRQEPAKANKPEYGAFRLRKGAENLLPYGYEIFQNPPSTFEPTLNAATPESYQLGPGDQLVITVWGDTKLYYQLQVNRDGNLLVPDVGPIGANGYTIQQFRERLLKRMSEIYSGLNAQKNGPTAFLDVSIGKLRTIQVFVLGEAAKPGGYTLSSMSTTLHALYLAGGPTSNGTMRNVQIIRAGKQPIRYDLYDYIIRGDKTNDTRLQNGDVVFVSPAGRRAAVAGEVVRPAIYELGNGETLGDLIQLAGGLRFDAYLDRIHIERIVPFAERPKYSKDVIDLDVKFKTIGELMGSKEPIEDGDVVTVLKISDIPNNRVTVLGNVRKPGVFELTPEMRIADLIMAADSLDRNTFEERGNLIRLLPSLRREIIAFNPRLALAHDPQNNIVLQNEDSVILYKESEFFPEHRVTISGAVRNPGEYLRVEGMTAGDLAVLAGGLTEDAMTTGWTVSRIDSTSLQTYSHVYTLDLPREYWNDTGSSKFPLEDFDHVFVPANPRFSRIKTVKVTGYVMYPGTYAIRNEGERLAEVIARAGGMRPGAYLEGSKFVRKLTDATWTPSEPKITTTKNTSLLDSLRQANKVNEEAGVGWIPIDFKRAIDDPSSRENIVLEAGDSINVAYLEDLVYVKGQVFIPSPVVYKRHESLDYYITQAGGFTDAADKGKVVVFLPGGKKWEPRSWPFPDPEILPGSLVYVPQKVEREDKTLPIVSAWATVMASLAAITIAIVQITK